MFFLTPTLDLDIFLLINQQWRCSLFDIVMPVFSSATVLFIMLGMALVFVAIKSGKRELALFLILLAGMGLSDFSTNIVKKQVQRVRPLNAVAGTYYQEDNGQWNTRPMDFVQTKEHGTSYPSAHSSTSMCLAVLAILLWPALRKWPLILPLLVGYSRIYLGKHYPTDVMAGWLWGLMVALVIWLIWNEIRKRLPSANNA